MRNIGFSTGAVAYGDFALALDVLAPRNLPCVELSALRITEVQGLIDAIPTLDLSAYKYISFHAPSSFLAEQERWLVNLLYSHVPNEWTIVLHPDAISDFALWRRLGRRIAIENMDRRKPGGRDVRELASIFSQLPEASLCFDVGHARQWDSSMTEAFLMLTAFREKLVQVHLSEVNSESQHESISYGAKLAFQQIASLIPDALPIILESRVEVSEIDAEIRQAQESLSVESIGEHSFA